MATALQFIDPATLSFPTEHQPTYDVTLVYERASRARKARECFHASYTSVGEAEAAVKRLMNEPNVHGAYIHRVQKTTIAIWV